MSSHSFALVMIGINPVFNRFLGLVVENTKCAQNILHYCTAVHTVPVFIQSSFNVSFSAYMCECECACAKNKETPFQAKKTKKVRL